MRISDWSSDVCSSDLLADGTEVTAERILIATGGWPYVPEFPGSEHAITSNEVFHLDKLPKRIVIAGGGYIANEFAGIFNEFGSKVTIVNRSDTRSEEHTSELQSLMRSSYAVFSLKKKKHTNKTKRPKSTTD